MTVLPELDLDDQELALLGASLGGCDFTDTDRRRFLTSTDDLDVQAAPGSGKTTLLVAKLRILLRRWEEPRQGMCVLSHTNAARREVENRLTEPEAAALLSYPHFIGTITAFIHKFVALPYLRGLGWAVSHINDDIFAARAVRRLRDCPFLWGQNRKRDQFKIWVKSLSLAEDADLDRGSPPERLAVAVDRMPGPHTRTRQAFESIKASLAAEGVFRFDDMMVFAKRALDECPSWADRLGSRFPIVLVDEAQDTSAEHLSLVESIFSERSVVQHLGDSNQTIFEARRTDAGWVPRGGHVDLGTSHRFGSPVADFASKLTIRSPQQIAGSPHCTSRAVLMTFEDAEQVIPAFSCMCKAVLAEDCTRLWAVASVHRPGDGQSSVSLQDYSSTYRAPTIGRRPGADTLHAVVRDAAIRAQAGAPLSEQVRSCARGLTTFLRVQGVPEFQDSIPTRQLWDVLNSLAEGSGDAARRITRECVLGRGLAPWAETKKALVDAVRPIISGQNATAACRRYLQVAVEQDQELGIDARTAQGGMPVPIRLGSVASVKGQTHDATLVVQTTIRGTKDVKTALQVAAGLRTRPRADQPVLARATTNVFVGSTRPRFLLCLALPAADLDDSLRDAIRDGCGSSNVKPHATILSSANSLAA